MAKQLVSDELWAVVEPLLPATRSLGTRGHPPVPNRVALAGIILGQVIRRVRHLAEDYARRLGSS